jgi:hypothetical protein
MLHRNEAKHSIVKSIYKYQSHTGIFQTMVEACYLRSHSNIKPDGARFESANTVGDEPLTIAKSIYLDGSISVCSSGHIAE